MIICICCTSNVHFCTIHIHRTYIVFLKFTFVCMKNVLFLTNMQYIKCTSDKPWSWLHAHCNVQHTFSDVHSTYINFESHVHMCVQTMNNIFLECKFYVLFTCYENVSSMCIAASLTMYFSFLLMYIKCPFWVVLCYIRCAFLTHSNVHFLLTHTVTLNLHFQMYDNSTSRLFWRMTIVVLSNSLVAWELHITCSFQYTSFCTLLHWTCLFGCTSYLKQICINTTLQRTLQFTFFYC